MLNIQKIVEIINSLGIKTFTFDYSIYNNYIYNMLAWYKNTVPTFHFETQWNGFQNCTIEKARLGMAKRGCEDKASLIFNENLQLNILDNDVKEYLLGFDENTGILGKNDFWSNVSKLYELTSALGTGAYEIILNNLLQYGDRLVSTDDTKIKLVTHDATEIIPLSWDQNMNIEEVCFIDQYKTKKNNNESILEIRLHIKDEETGHYLIINKKIKVFDGVVDNDGLNKLIFLDNDGVIDTFDTMSDIPWFSIVKPAAINNYNIHCPMGASIYGNAIDIMKNIDDAFNALSTEFRFGCKKVFYSTRLLNRDPKTDRVVIPEDTNKNWFYYMSDENGLKDNEYIHEWNPSLRVDELTKGIDSLLNYYSTLIGLGNNYYKFNNGTVEKTATEVISENSVMFRNIRKDEIACEQFLLRLFKALIYVSNFVYKTNYDVDAKIGIRFDQSIIEDKEAERERSLEEVRLGIMTVDEYREKYYTTGRKDTEALG